MRDARAEELPWPPVLAPAGEFGPLSPERPAGRRRLAMVGIAAPFGFIVVVELVRLLVVERSLVDRGHLVLGSVTLLSVVVFGSAMCWYVDRTRRAIVRHNRELSAVNVVTTAIRGNLGVDEVIDAALRSVLAVSGAIEISLTICASEGRARHEDGVTRWRVVRSAPPPAGRLIGTPPLVVDVALLAGVALVGTMRLRLAAHADRTQRLSAGVLRDIGEQVGSAIQRCQLFADLQRRKREGHALYDLLIQISGQASTWEALVALVRSARDLLSADQAVLCLNDSASRSMPADQPAIGSGGAVCIVPEAAEVCGKHAPGCPTRSAAAFPATVCAPLRGPKGTLGTLWLGRHSRTPFSGRDSAYLNTLSELAVIAIGSARTLESERQGAILGERERIARELHDSLAQVLGVAHLRLHSLGSRPEVDTLPQIQAELADLAGLCHEAYRDVRESILGLRESSRPDRALLDSLRAYADKFSRQSGIRTTLVSRLDRDLALTPRCEVQMIRVIQEALTNARKHSGARTAVIQVDATPAGTTFVIEDDGHGFDPSMVPDGRDGFGIASMGERVRLVNGSLSIDSAPGRGTRVIVGLPPSSHSPVPSVPMAVQV